MFPECWYTAVLDTNHWFESSLYFGKKSGLVSRTMQRLLSLLYPASFWKSILSMSNTKRLYPNLANLLNFKALYFFRSYVAARNLNILIQLNHDIIIPKSSTTSIKQYPKTTKQHCFSGVFFENPHYAGKRLSTSMPQTENCNWSSVRFIQGGLQPLTRRGPRNPMEHPRKTNECRP